jgi:hypothetical protein
MDPKQAQQIAQNLNVEKTALGQLKQLNPSINPQKAAMAATKDIATMNPQEKEVLAQVAKTLSPALGTPAFGSINLHVRRPDFERQARPLCRIRVGSRACACRLAIDQHIPWSDAPVFAAHDGPIQVHIRPRLTCIPHGIYK